MKFLGWITKGNAARQQSVAEKPQMPETAKEMYSRQEAQEKAAARPITPEIKAQADRALSTINKASQHLQSQSPSQESDGGSNAGYLQKQDHQGKAQEALSPTDGREGKTAAQDKSKVPDKAVSQIPKTVARRPPSWER